MLMSSSLFDEKLPQTNKLTLKILKKFESKYQLGANFCMTYSVCPLNAISGDKTLEMV